MSAMTSDKTLWERIAEWREHAANLINGGNGWTPNPYSDRARTKNELADSET
jgi:hypothetical protein